MGQQFCNDPTSDTVARAHQSARLAVATSEHLDPSPSPQSIRSVLDRLCTGLTSSDELLSESVVVVSQVETIC